MNESGFLFLRKFGKISIRKIVPESGTQGESGNGGDQKKVVPESGTQGESGNGGDQKKVVPKSGTQRECRNRQRSEESCTGIRYAGKIQKWAVIERKLYRNPVRQGESGNGGDQKKVVPESGTQRECGNRQRSEESCTGIRYAERIREQAAIRRKLYRNPVRRENLGTAAIRRKLYRNPVRRENAGTGSDQKKVVPESGTQERSRNGQ